MTARLGEAWSVEELIACADERLYAAKDAWQEPHRIWLSRPARPSYEAAACASS